MSAMGHFGLLHFLSVVLCERSQSVGLVGDSHWDVFSLEDSRDFSVYSGKTYYLN